MTADDFDFLAQAAEGALGPRADARQGLSAREPAAAGRAQARAQVASTSWSPRLRARPDADLVRDVVEAMTTNESFFFRDIKPFEQFKHVVLPALLKARAAQRRRSGSGAPPARAGRSPIRWP